MEDRALFDGIEDLKIRLFDGGEALRLSARLNERHLAAAIAYRGDGRLMDEHSDASAAHGGVAAAYINYQFGLFHLSLNIALNRTSGNPMMLAYSPMYRSTVPSSCTPYAPALSSGEPPAT